MPKTQEKPSVAVLGATGNVGRLLIDILEDRNFPMRELKLLASERSAGQKVKSKNGNEYTVEATTQEAFKGIDIVFASAGSQISKQFAPAIVEYGGVIIDNSSAFRMDSNVPLIVPQVNGEDVKKHHGIIANPNCSTAPLVLALKPLDQIFGIKRVIVSTYQSVSGAGKAAMDELTAASRKSLDDQAHNYQHFIKPIAFNLIPQIDVFTDNGYTKEELKVINESRKILHRPDLAITCTAVRVPVFICHSESVNVEFKSKITLAEIKKIWSQTQDLEIIDDHKQSLYPTPLEVQDTDPVYVGRIREDESQPNTINFWLVADNLRIGAALNAVKIGEKLLECKFAL